MGRRRKRKNPGRQYEEHCADKMKWQGFWAVEQIGKTGDFGADIVARGFWFQKIVVQCKHYTGKVGVKAVQEVIAARQYYGASRAAVATNSTFTKAAEELARKCRVELWERY